MGQPEIHHGQCIIASVGMYVCEWPSLNDSDFMFDHVIELLDCTTFPRQDFKLDHSP